ncbi:MAG: DUF1569 domain-containing protein [Phycisphaerales bacterium]
MSQAAQAPTPVDTKTAERRDLQFKDFTDVEADLDLLEQAMQAGTLTSTGNWSPGENFDHLAKFLEFAYDGFPSKAPPPVRWIARMMFKNKATHTEEPFPAGFKLPKQASALLPREGVTDQEGLAYLRSQVSRVLQGEQMTQPSPLLGQLTPEEWVTLQRKHMALHLSFLHPGS